MNLWGLFVFTFFFMALFFRVKAVYIALVTTALLYFAGGALIDRGFAGLRVERARSRSYLFPGEHAPITVRFINRSIIPFAWLSAHDHLPARLARGNPRKWVMSVPPYGEVAYTYSVSSSRRGVYTIGPIDLIAGDPLGLHQRSGAAQNFHDVIVYPEILTLPQLGLPTDLPVGNEAALSPIYPDPARIAGIRTYVPGDVHQSIHWKATARTGEMQVKQHEHTVSLDVFLILNMREGDYVAPDGSYLDSELPVTTAAALAHRLGRGGESFGFLTNAALVRYRAEEGKAGAAEVIGGDRGASVVRVLPRKGNRQLMRVLEILAGAELAPSPQTEAETQGTGSSSIFPRLVAEEARHFGWGATLLLVTPVATRALIETSVMLRRSGFKVSIFATARVRQEAAKVDRGLGPAIYQVRQERDRTLRMDTSGGGIAVG